MNTKCIACGKNLDSDRDDEERDSDATCYPIIYSGIVFRSSGQFGSRILDNIHDDNIEIQIIICDQCIIEKNEMADMVIQTKRLKIEKESEYRKFTDEYDKKQREYIIAQLKKDGNYIPPHITKWKNR